MCCQHWLHFVHTVALLYMVLKHASAWPKQNKRRDLIILPKETRRQTHNSNDCSLCTREALPISKSNHKTGDCLKYMHHARSYGVQVKERVCEI